jgi:hypothetical protein
MARAVHLRLPWTSPLSLALGTWLVYIADRILDGLAGAPAARLRERHLFYARNRGPVFVAAIVMIAILSWLVISRIKPSARLEDTALLVVAFVYFCLVHLCGTAIERWFPKEAAVAAVFAAAVAVPAWSRLPGQHERLFPLIAIYALLCWMNCVAIEKWESGPLSISLPHRTTRWAAHHLRLLACSIAIVAGLVGLHFFLTALPAPVMAMTAVYAACALSALFFALLDRLPLDSPQLRVAADAALLTPILFLSVLR